MAGGAVEPRWGSSSGVREEAWFNGLGVFVGFSGSVAPRSLLEGSVGLATGEGRGFRVNTGEPGPTSMWFTAALVVTLSLSYFDFGRLDLPSASLDARGG